MNEANSEQREQPRNISSVVPQLRQKVRAVNRRILSDGAKLLFDCLTELLFLDIFSRVRGVVKVGHPVLARMLGWSVSSVERHARQLENDRRIWRRIQYEARSKVTLWHIREVVDSQLEFFDQPNRSFLPNRVHRPKPIQGKGGRFVALGQDGANGRTDIDGKIRENRAVSPELTVSSRQNCRDYHGRTAETVTAELPRQSPQNCRDHHGRTDGTIPAELTVLSPQNCTVEDGRIDGIIPAELPRHKDVQDVKKDSGRLSLKRSTGFNAQDAAGGGKKIKAENLFLLDVGAMMERWRKESSKAELANSGAWWRMSYRANPDLIARVLADTLCAVKEGRIKESPGQYAADLWKRWSKDLLKDKLRKQKATAATAAH